MIGCYVPLRIKTGYKFKFLFIKLFSKYDLIPCGRCDWCKEYFKHPCADMSYNEYLRRNF